MLLSWISFLLLVLDDSDAILFLLSLHFLDHRALVAKALIENPNLINWWLTIKALYGLIALIFGNGYIVGINQIYDIGIDKYAKLHLIFA